MANIGRSRRLFRPGDKYHYAVDNAPLEDMWSAIEAVNAEQNGILSEIISARGDTQNIGARINRHSMPDGRIRMESINDPFDYTDTSVNEETIKFNSDTIVNYNGSRMPGVRNKYMQSISAHYDSSEHVRMATAERSKLSGIEPRATRNIIRIGDNAEPISSGEVNIRPGHGIDIQQLGQNVIINSLLPLDLLHKHVYNERPRPYPPTTRDVRTGVQSAVEIDGNARTFLLNDSYATGTLQVFINGVRQDPVRISEDDPQAGIFSFQNWVVDLPDETNNDALRVDYIVKFGLGSAVSQSKFTAYEAFRGFGNAISDAVRSTWKLQSLAIIQSNLHQLFLNGQHMKMRPYPFDPNDTTRYDWQFGNVTGRVDGITIKRDAFGNLVSDYVVWINANIEIQPEDEISIYYQS
jgi:hypothetical protein